MTFKDHFSNHSQEYSAFRPRYPEPLFSYLASLCDTHELAWDCATGSGQAAVGLADYFREVAATDASENQIANASQLKGVTYSVALAENSGIQAGSVNLITVAQALHWFDIDAFTVESNRVLKVEGVLAVWTYGLLTFGKGFDDIIEHFYKDIVGPFWPFERQLVEGGYAEIIMPFEELPVTPMEMIERWRFADLMGYLNTWSAVRAYEKEHGKNPVELVHDDLLRAWGGPDAVHDATWPLKIRIWRKTSKQSKYAPASLVGAH